MISETMTESLNVPVSFESEHLFVFAWCLPSLLTSSFLCRAHVSLPDATDTVPSPASAQSANRSPFRLLHPGEGQFPSLVDIGWFD